VLYFGSSTPAMKEASAALENQGVHLDMMRLRAFPFAEAVSDFILKHDQVFLVEQNRDAQMRSLIVNECGIDPARIVSVLNYDGTPITARFITGTIAERLLMKSKEAAE
jgi:2-oxoglutarate ferredoxin oxidoreductase subunit alpha